MNRPLGTRVSNLESALGQSLDLKRRYHIFRPIINPDGTVEKVLETIIEDGVVIRNDCGRSLG